MSQIRTLIFDLGGVLLNIDYRLTEKAFLALGLAHINEMFTQQHASQLFTNLETGKIAEAEFITGIKKEISKPVSDEQIINAWTAMLLDFPPERIALLKQIRANYDLYLLSNTNAVHTAVLDRKLQLEYDVSSLEPFFNKVYYSHQMGKRKPGLEIFEQVIKENGLEPAATLFIDDTFSNITGALQAGLQALLLEPPRTVNDLFINGKLKENLINDD